MTMDASDDPRLSALLPRLRRFARSLAGDGADDIVQAALERALRRWDSRRDEEALQAWLFAIVYRQFVTEHRRARRWQRVLELFGAEAVEPVPSPERIHEGQAMLAAFARLPPDHRALLLLVSVEGFSYREAADMLGLPIGTVMSRLSRARERLRALADDGAASPRTLRVLK